MEFGLPEDDFKLVLDYLNDSTRELKIFYKRYVDVLGSCCDIRKKLPDLLFSINGY